MTTTQTPPTLEEFIEAMEKAALQSFDDTVQAYAAAGPQSPPPELHGWKDQELPELLEAIRRHAAAVYERYDWPFIYGGPISSK